MGTKGLSFLCLQLGAIPTLLVQGVPVESIFLESALDEDNVALRVTFWREQLEGLVQDEIIIDVVMIARHPIRS